MNGRSTKILKPIPETANKPKRKSYMQTFDRIQWLKSRTLSKNLADRTVQLEYIKHVSEMGQYSDTKSVFDYFDDDGNRIIDDN